MSLLLDQHSVAFPARFILIAACNPCPCGFAGDPIKQCVCTQNQLVHYQNKLSGPLLDRIDMHIQVGRIETQAILSEQSKDTTSYSQPISKARSVQHNRFMDQSIHTNSAMNTKDTRTFCPLSSSAQQLLSTASERLNLSTRSYIRTIKVARTIADMDCSSEIESHHIAEALQYRQAGMVENQTLISR